MRTWIKICGTTSFDDALAAMDAGANAVGFIFAPSRRKVLANQAEEISARLPAEFEKIGVFSNQSVKEVAEIADQAGLTGIQLHGDETAAFIDEFKARLRSGRRIDIIKTVLVDENFENRLSQVRQDQNLDAILLDSGSGSGRTFDWLRAQPLLGGSGKRLIVAGGLNPGNVGEAISNFSPWGVDVVSGVEREPGRKDPDKLKAFVAEVRRAEQL